MTTKTWWSWISYFQILSSSEYLGTRIVLLSDFAWQSFNIFNDLKTFWVSGCNQAITYTSYVSNYRFTNESLFEPVLSWIPRKCEQSFCSHLSMCDCTGLSQSFLDGSWPIWVSRAVSSHMTVTPYFNYFVLSPFCLFEIGWHGSPDWCIISYTILFSAPSFIIPNTVRFLNCHQASR